MSPPLQLDCDFFRVLLFRKEGGELLLEETEQGSVLPSLEIPPHSRVAERLTSAIKALWGLCVYCLFELPNGSIGKQVRYQVAELRSDADELASNQRWASVIALNATDFANQDDLVAVQAALAAFGARRPAGPFGKPGWLAEVADWVAAEAGALGLEVTGEIRQLNASPTFSLLRFASKGPALWFKAVGDPNLHEYAITLELAERFPTYLPKIVASRPDWNAWLSVEAEGKHLNEMSSLLDWADAAAALAELQIASWGQGLHLIELGCKDVRVSSLLKRVDPFFCCMTKLMMAQTKQPPAPLTLPEIATLTRDIRNALEELGESELPNVIGHLDCNPGNILVSQQRTVFLDWAEGCVGHSFFTLQYLLEHRRRVHKSDRDEEPLVSAYVGPWKSFISPQGIARDLPLIPLVSAFAYAASGSALCRAEYRPETAAFLRSITRRMKREADALHYGRIACAH